MQFSETWLRSLVDPSLNTQQLGHLLTMAGLEVEAIEPAAAAFTQVVVGEILAAAKHPDADRLQVCQVDVGEAEPLTIVCGAPNARAGLKTACARVGAELPGLRIKRAKVRGVESFGMLCSGRELGMADAADGILELPADAAVGGDLRALLDLDDQRITLKLTPNRGDCLSIAGIAREVAALTGAPLTTVDCTPVAASLPDTLPVGIGPVAACPRYTGRVIRGINPAATTPRWMVARLERAGLRAIHPVVDVTNYVMLELGEPMHAFDLARLHGGIQVRLARPGERLALLNGQEIALDDDALVIADGHAPLALAGVMGGNDSAVGDATRDLFLEAAHFIPAAIAGRARAHALSTDSAHRFERGVDPELPRRAMERATRLILDICGGECGPVVEAGPGVAPSAPIAFRPERARRLLGYAMSDEAMAAILTRLGLTVRPAGDGLLASAPSHRFDLTREVDLIEEVARVHGYEATPAVPLSGGHAMLQAAEGARGELELRQLMVARGYQEVITYSFIAAELDADFRDGGASLPLLNPIASQMGVMRGSLLGGLVQALRHNLNHGQERLRLFEVGRAFLSGDADGQPPRLAGLAHGASRPEQWGEPTRPVDYFDVRADLEPLLPAGARFEAAAHPALHPGQCARISLSGRPIGWLGALHPRLSQKYGLSRSPLLFELDVAALAPRPVARYQQVARHPAVRRDVALLVDAGVRVGEMLACIRQASLPLVAGFELFDVYQGHGIHEGKKSLAFNMLLQHTEKTLTDSEIDTAVRDVVNILNNNFNATLRA